MPAELENKSNIKQENAKQESKTQSAEFAANNMDLDFDGFNKQNPANETINRSPDYIKELSEKLTQARQDIKERESNIEARMNKINNMNISQEAKDEIKNDIYKGLEQEQQRATKLEQEYKRSTSVDKGEQAKYTNKNEELQKPQEQSAVAKYFTNIKNENARDENKHSQLPQTQSRASTATSERQNSFQQRLQNSRDGSKSEYGI